MVAADTAGSILLALETSGDVCSLAVLRGGVTIVERLFRHEMHLSERLMDQIDSALRDAGASLARVDAFAVGVGPGSFTGTRIGVMTIKTFATVGSRPVYGIDSLMALAAEYSGLTDLCIVPMQPCRNGVVYTGAYRFREWVPEPLWPTDALDIATLADRLRGPVAVRQGGGTEPAIDRERSASDWAHRICFCGSAADRYRSALEELLLPGMSLSFGGAAFPRASVVGLLAWRRHLVGDCDAALTLAPRYISPPPITMPRQPIPQPSPRDETGISQV
jgi:tRNA threonylcarbamoyladenosine biosynthesis protein TsaB